jgi:hypothetical protein
MDKVQALIRYWLMVGLIVGAVALIGLFLVKG